MSPRVAWWLESFGFATVYDYAPGEADWFAFGLPVEGAKAGLPQVERYARRDVPRCSLSEPIGEVRERVQAVGWDTCAVVNDEQVVLGLLREREFAADPNAIADRVMRSGPATYRPDTVVADAVEHLEKRGAGGVLITRSDGHLIGWLRREDAVRAVREGRSEPTSQD